MYNGSGRVGGRVTVVIGRDGIKKRAIIIFFFVKKKAMRHGMREREKKERKIGSRHTKNSTTNSTNK